jgi:hypothetical protein
MIPSSPKSVQVDLLICYLVTDVICVAGARKRFAQGIAVDIWRYVVHSHCIRLRIGNE